MKLEINSTQKFGKFENTWKVNNTLKKNQSELENILNWMEKQHTKSYNAAKTVRRRRGTTLTIRITNKESSQNSNFGARRGSLAAKLLAVSLN